MNIIEFLNRPFPGTPDPQITRLIIVLFVMAVAFGWTKDMFRNWSIWGRKVKRVTQWLTGLLIVNGFALLASAQRDDPIRIITAVLGATFFGLACSIYIHFEDDESTAPIYPELYPSALWGRFRSR